MEKDSISHTFRTRTGDLDLNNVLVVCEMKKNLLSIHKLTRDNNCSITLFADKFVIYRIHRGIF